MRIFTLFPAAALLTGVLYFAPVAAQGPVGISGGLAAGLREVLEDQGRLLIRTDSAYYRLQGEVIVEIGAGRSVTVGAGEAAKPELCPPPTEPFACGVTVPAALPELVHELVPE